MLLPEDVDEGKDGEALVMQFLDASRDGIGERYVFARKKTFVVRDEIRWEAFEFAVRGNFLQNEFVQGSLSPCVFRHGTRQRRYCVHGDDYVEVGSQSDVDWYLQRARERLSITEWSAFGLAESGTYKS